MLFNPNPTSLQGDALEGSHLPQVQAELLKTVLRIGGGGEWSTASLSSRPAPWLGYLQSGVPLQTVHPNPSFQGQEQSQQN